MYCKLAPTAPFCTVKHNHPECVNMGYMFNEKMNPVDDDDNLRCITDCQCDGIRKCIDETKMCETIPARTEKFCESEEYHIE